MSDKIVFFHQKPAIVCRLDLPESRRFFRSAVIESVSLFALSDCEVETNCCSSLKLENTAEVLLK